MFSRNTAPEHCTRGSDSIGRQRRFSPISRSACAGTMSPGAVESVGAGASVFTDGRGALRRGAFASALVCGVVGLDLLVETTRHGGGFIHRGIVLLRQHLVEVGLLSILLVLRRLVRRRA